jgi:hypothetical protein
MIAGAPMALVYSLDAVRGAADRGPALAALAVSSVEVVALVSLLVSATLRA